MATSLPTVALVAGPQATADFEALVRCRTVLADLDWSHRIWPESNPEPKPPRQQVLPDAEIRRQVDDWLRKETALRAMYGLELDAKALQTELNRMALQTRAPDRLREQFRALGDDAEMVANCVARPLLAERRLREGYAQDERWHGELRKRAEAAFAAGASSEAIEVSGGTEQTLTLALRDEENAGDAADPGNGELRMSAEEFDRERARLIAAEPDVSGKASAPSSSQAGLRETPEAFIEEKVLSQAEDQLVVRSRVWAKQPFDAWWSARRSGHATFGVSKRSGALSLPAIQGQAAAAPEAAADTWKTFALPSERYVHTAVWTGSEMIVWGGTQGSGSLDTGSRYNPATDSWMATTTTGAPSARYWHTAVWTGSEMIVWGGYSGSSRLATGGRYNPAMDSWTLPTTTGVPSARERHTAVWAGSEMMVWGGAGGSNTGARYNPATDGWTASSTTGAPTARSEHTAVWTGSEMIVWGGNPNTNTGGRYNPATDSWTATTTTGAPSARHIHTAVWTGSEMIVWGGTPGSGSLNTGGRFNPATNSWTATTTTGAPSARHIHTVVWNGNEMIVWGGTPSSGSLNTGGRYNPAADSWTATPTTSAPGARYHHTAVWTGSEMIVWGGRDESVILVSGGRFSPSTDSWTATNTTGSPSARHIHTAVWTGTEMIVWGGFPRTNTGGRYDPATNSWTATTTSAAPSGRYSHTAVWTGNEMIVWGGRDESSYLATGGRYDPATDSWTATTTTGAPSGRHVHTTVWTGSEMIVWGGSDESVILATGGRYSPSTDSWTATPTTGAPNARGQHTAVWTGNQMIVWGGYSGSAELATGGRYNPVTDSWVATLTTSAPSARRVHTAVWTDSEMVVWGGYFGGSGLATGGRYSPATDSWTATTVTGAPSARYQHTAVWTGSEMIVWGGFPRTNTGGRYDPATNNWTATMTMGAPSARNSHTAVWTGLEMMVFGGCCTIAELGVYYPNAVDDSTSAITAALPDPSVVGQGVTIDVSLAGDTIQPTDGQVVITASTGESCIDTTASVGTGTTALFSCDITFATAGLRTLTAVYSASTSHFASTSAAEPQQVLALPALGISDVSALEGSGGTTAFEFTITRSHTLNAASVQVDTVNGTATAGSDYMAIVGQTVSMPPGGAATATVMVNVAGDTVLEPNEAFVVNLSNASGATISDGQGQGTIQNDDTATVAINDVVQAEGDSGFGSFAFTATLTGTVQDGFDLPWSSRDGTAISGSDYTAGSGTLNFSGSNGETRQVAVAVAGELEPEADEDFFVDLGTPSVAGISANPASGTGVIVNDDLYADVSVTLDNGLGAVLPGQGTTYTLVVRNTSIVIDLSAVRIETALPTGSVLEGLSWTCSGSGGASCSAPTGNGLIDQVRALPKDGVLTFQITATVSGSALPPASASLAAMATVQSPYSDPQPGNNSATDSDPVLGDIVFWNGFELVP